MVSKRAPAGELEFAQRALAGLAGAVLLFSLLQDLTGRRFVYVNLLDVDVEASVYTWLSSGLILVNALILLHVAWTRRDQGQVDWKGWATVGTVVLGLSAEEVVGVHERFTSHVAPILGAHGVDLRVAAWAVPATALGAVGLVLVMPFLRGLPRQTRQGLLLAGGVYAFGALGMEFVDQAVHWGGLADEAGLAALIGHVEEALEFTGMFLLLRTLVAYRS